MSPDELEELRTRYRTTIKQLDLFGRDKNLYRLIPDPPDKKNKPPKALVGTIRQHYKALLLANKEGYGVFVQVNAADGSGNKHGNIVSAPCLFADFDGAPLENLRLFPIAPHLVIETSPGKFHVYWCVEGIPLDRFKEMQQRLAGLFGSDPKVCDLPRLMRLAGFYHLKNPEAPHLVRIIEQP